MKAKNEYFISNLWTMWTWAYGRINNMTAPYDNIGF